MTLDEFIKWVSSNGIMALIAVFATLSVFIIVLAVLITPIQQNALEGFMENASYSCNICLNNQGQSNLTPLSYFGKNMDNKTLYNACNKNCTLALENMLS